MKKKRILVLSILIPLLSIASVFAGLAWGGIFNSLKNNAEETALEERTEPLDPTKYWDESDEIQAIVADGNPSIIWDGAGSKTNPYLISSPTQLAWLAYRTAFMYEDFNNKYFKQTCDIDVSKYWWQPIGAIQNHSNGLRSNALPFSGFYDGDNHIVSGMYIQKDKQTSFWGYGLFGWISTRTANTIIKNLGVVNSYINVEVGSVGGLVGSVELSNSDFVIENCYSIVNIEGQGDNVGGMAGYITGARNIKFNNCYNLKNIAGQLNVGGLLGNGDGIFNKIEIFNSYNIGAITQLSSTTGAVGGIVGSGDLSIPTTILNCFNLGSINGFSVGAIAGSAKAIITNSYWGGGCSIEIASPNESAVIENCAKLTDITTKAKTQAWYEDSSVWAEEYPWDFENVWEVSAKINDGYPYFAYHFAGTGTKDDPYLIQNEYELRMLSQKVNNVKSYSGQYFEQTADIRMSEEIFTPIGEVSSKPFSGSFNGNNFTILGLNIKSSKQNVGLFGKLGGVVENVNIRESFISGSTTSGANVGSIAGEASESNSKIFNCSSDATIEVLSAYTGGIVGMLRFSGVVEKCTFNGSITGTSFEAGGIVGEIDRSTIKECFCFGNISSTYNKAFVGGLLGYDSSSSTSYISKSIFKGTISGSYYVGGICAATTAMNVSNCLVNGYIRLNDSTSNQYAGGMSAYSASIKATFESCSFVGSSNKVISLLDGGTRATFNGCYSQINNRKGYSGGDFSGFTVVPNMNEDLPMQNNLFSIAIGGQTSEYVIDYLNSKGFSLVA